jgi:hypothetical protein
MINRLMPCFDIMTNLKCLKAKVSSLTLPISHLLSDLSGSVVRFLKEKLSNRQIEAPEEQGLRFEPEPERGKS